MYLHQIASSRDEKNKQLFYSPEVVESLRGFIEASEKEMSKHTGSWRTDRKWELTMKLTNVRYKLLSQDTTLYTGCCLKVYK